MLGVLMRLRLIAAILVALPGAAIAQVSSEAKSYSIWFNSPDNQSVLALGPESDEPSVVSLDCDNGKVKGLYNKYYANGALLKFQNGNSAIDVTGKPTRIMGQNLVEFYPSAAELTFILSESPRLSVAGRVIVDAVPKPDDNVSKWASYCKLPLKLAQHASPAKTSSPPAPASNACENKKHSAVPTAIHGKDYYKAREMLIKAGWQPNTHNGTTLDGIASDVWQSGFAEVTGCAATGSAACEFSFSDMYGSKLSVFTQGEFDPKRKNSIGVFKYQLVCER